MPRSSSSSSDHDSDDSSSSENPDKFETVPIFYPTLEEMNDFDGYLLWLKNETKSPRVGLCKIVPPKDWIWKPELEQAKGFVVKNPIQQCVQGRAGVYSVCNVVKKDLSLRQFEDIALKSARTVEDENELDENEKYFQIERKFWKSLTTTKSAPLYGSDVQGSLFGNAKVAFNVNDLDCLLKRAGITLAGVTKPMMYVGMWRSFFPFHTEDLNMFSINYNHLGEPKFWYGVPPTETARMESLGKSSWPDENCPELLRHKTKMFSPTRLKQSGVPFVRGVQRAGDIMITWPSSFHGGFNAGFNVAEAVNFCPPSLSDFFMEFARRARVCQCRPDSVTINVDWLQNRFDIALGRKSSKALNANSDGKSHKRKNSTPSPIKFAGPMFIEIDQNEKLKSRPVLDVKTGDFVEVHTLMKIEGTENDEASPVVVRWVPYKVISEVEGFIRLRERHCRKVGDFWLSARSDRLRKALEKE